MKISLNWLSDFVDFTEKNPQAIAARVTEAVAEVDDVVEQGALLRDCCVAAVVSLTKHPNADKLSLCEVRTDRGMKKVVCGGTNLREGMRVAFAHVGATVLDHDGGLFTLSTAKIRGETSEGMICAAEELDLGDTYPPGPDEGNRPIIDLGDGTEGVGAPLREYLHMDDIVLHIDNHAITHRADLFSHIGFARECVAIGIAQWKNKPSYDLPSFSKTALPFGVHNDCPDLVPRYSACLLSIDGLGETPDWMKHRLAATGWRSVSLPVDITNFVATEVGMPLHSFDAGDFCGAIRIRTAKAGETITTLDDVKRQLPEGAIVISDDDGIFDLLGIMGGLRSSTKAATRSVYLHSAIVDPVSIRRAIIATGHRTDAATVYEKGVPRITSLHGFARALQLFLELVPGAKIVSSMDSWGDDGSAKTLPLSCSKVRSMLGVDVPSGDIKTILEKLEFGVGGSGDQLTVTVPLHRLGDINGSHDLVEEVGRVYGYNSIDPILPSGSVAPPPRDMRLRTIRRSLKEQGCIEFLPLSLLGPDLLSMCNMDPAAAAAIENPIGEELSLMQPCVTPRLLDHASSNIGQIEEMLATFHVGTVFGPDGDAYKALGALVACKRPPDLLHDPFLVLKDRLSTALADAGYSLTALPTSSAHVAAHPGRAADLVVGAERVGSLFEVHPSVRDRFGLPARAAIGIVNVTALFAIAPRTMIAHPLKKFPPVVYDVTVTLDQSKQVAALLAKIQGAHTLLESVAVVDLYTGKPLAGDQYNLTLRCTYRSDDRTLTENEAQAEHAKVTALLTGV